MQTKRNVFFISDSTGITAETVGNSLLTQFEGVVFEKIMMPSINTPAKAQAALQQIAHSGALQAAEPLVFLTVSDPAILSLMQQSQGVVLDIFSPYLAMLEQALGQKAAHTVGRSHGVYDYEDYMRRIEAVNYTLSSDDGSQQTDYAQADCILLGVSRCGKTPTCLYLAMQFGLYAANYPFTAEDMPNIKLPDSLRKHKGKIFGLTIDPQRLAQVRQQRRAQGDYALLRQCRFEVAEVESLYQQEKITPINTSARSIEEIASEILVATRVQQV